MSSSSLDSQRRERPTERSSTYIDRGSAVPDFYSGTRLRSVVRDPETIFVDWESEDGAEDADGWHVAAYDADDNLLDAFETPPGRHRYGYLTFDDTSRAVRIVLSQRRDGDLIEVMQAGVRHLPSMSQAGDESWIDIRSRESVSVPASGRVNLGVDELGSSSSRTLSSRDARR